MISGPIQQTWHSDGNRNSSKCVERLRFSEEPRYSISLPALNTYAAYYLVTLLYNAMLISLYVVQAFGEHPACLTKGGNNITSRFEFAFHYGMVFLMVDSFNSHCLIIFFKYQTRMEELKYGIASKGTQRLLKITNLSEWIFRLGTLFLCLVQSLVMNSNKGTYCIKKLGVLSEEGKWLRWLIALQLFKVVVFPLWQTKYVQHFDEESSL